MKKFFILLLIILPKIILGQNYNFNKNIDWENTHIIINNISKNILGFDGALYDNDIIATYSETINLSNIGITNSNVKAEIYNISYEPITDKPFNYNALIKLSENIELKQKTFTGRDIIYLEYTFIPYIYKNNQLYRIKAFSLKITQLKSNNSTYNKKNSYASNSVLSSGTWVKIGIVQSGIYKLTYEELENLGFSNPSSVRVFGNDAGMLPFTNDKTTTDDLIENYIYKGSNYILFYADASSRWIYDGNYFTRNTNCFSDTAYYFLTDKNTGFSNSIPTMSQSSSPTATITKYDYYDIHEENTINLLHSGRIWLGNEFIYTPEQTFNFTVPDIATGEQGKIILAMAVRSPYVSYLTTTAENTVKKDTFQIYYGERYFQYVDYKKIIFSFSQTDSDVGLNLNYTKPSSSSNAWIDYLVINAKCNLKYRSQLIFQSTENIGIGNISKFQMSSADNNVNIWDITEPTRPQKMAYTISGLTLSFSTETDTLKRFISFKDDDCLSPITEGEGLGNISNQNLHNVSTTTDMLIITHPSFISQANSVAEIHKTHDNLDCKVVTTEQIYNEFSGGMQDVPAIRNYIRMVYEKTSNSLKFVLLFGDGTYNYKDATNSTNPNYTPTYQPYNSFNIGGISTTSDDFFTFMDEDEGEIGYGEGMDLAIGRFPVKSSEEADVMVEKLKAYYNPQNFGDWHNIITLAADDRDQGADVFTTDAEKLANKIDTLIPFINIKKIYLDSYQQQTSANGQEYPDALVDFNNRVNNGSLIINYLGHGSEHALSSEGLVTTNTIKTWTNIDKLPLFITGTCEFSKFDDADPDEDVTSAGEMIILSSEGGGIALLTTARVSYSGTNLYINENFYSYLFSKQNDEPLTIGQAYMNSKNEMQSYNKYLFVLLGDPAVRLQYPDNNIDILKINGVEASSFSDTLKALDTVVVSGHVTNSTGTVLNDFDGILELTYFDKKRILQTLNNDGNGEMSYWSQYNKLFRGRASITDGIFEIDFIIPKDIYFNFDKSKFSLFAYSDSKQATGYNRNVILGGINSNAAADNNPPQIKLYMNDSSFVDGGITDNTPSVFAILEDENGINTSTASIGHDILLTIDNDPYQAFSINEYYQSDVDNYKRGTVKYQIYQLDAGSHTASLKAWDIYNNSTEKSINFTVVEDSKLLISHLLNYPNPFTTKTSFYFEHNKPGVTFDIILQILTVSGKVVKTIHTQMNTDGYRSDAIDWDGKDDFGNPIGRGVYVYSLKIRTPDGEIVQKFEKLLILK